MSKSIYEEAFNQLDELVDVLAHIEGSFLYRHYLDNIRLKLKQAQKQEKLLELYKELSNFYVQLYTMELSELSLNSNYYELELIKLKSKIKELEK